jgi:hypothetical protein
MRIRALAGGLLLATLLVMNDAAEGKSDNIDSDLMILMLRKARAEMEAAKKTLSTAQVEQHATATEAEVPPDPMPSSQAKSSAVSTTVGNSMEQASRLTDNLKHEFSELLNATVHLNTAEAESSKLQQTVVAGEQNKQIAQHRVADSRLIDKVLRVAQNAEKYATDNAIDWHKETAVASTFAAKSKANELRSKTKAVVNLAADGSEEMLNKTKLAIVQDVNKVKLSQLHIDKTEARLSKAQEELDRTITEKKTLSMKVEAAKAKAQAAERAAKAAHSALQKLVSEATDAVAANVTAAETAKLAKQSEAVMQASVAMAKMKVEVAGQGLSSSQALNADFGGLVKAQIKGVESMIKANAEDARHQAATMKATLAKSEVEQRTQRAAAKLKLAQDEASVGEKEAQVTVASVRASAADASEKIAKATVRRVWKTQEKALHFDEKNLAGPVLAEMQGKVALKEARHAVRAASLKRKEVVTKQAGKETLMKGRLYKAESKLRQLKERVRVDAKAKNSAAVSQNTTDRSSTQKIEEAVTSLAKTKAKNAKTIEQLAEQVAEFHRKVRELAIQQAKQEQALQEKEVVAAEKWGELRGKKNAAEADARANGVATQDLRTQLMTKEIEIRKQNEELVVTQAKATAGLINSLQQDIQAKKSQKATLDKLEKAKEKKLDEAQKDLEHSSQQVSWATGKEKKALEHLTRGGLGNAEAPEVNQPLQKLPTVNPHTGNPLLSGKQDDAPQDATLLMPDSEATATEHSIREVSDAESSLKSLLSDEDKQVAWIKVTEDRLSELTEQQAKMQAGKEEDAAKLEAQVKSGKEIVRESKIMQTKLASRVEQAMLNQTKREEAAKQAAMLRVQSAVAAAAALKAQNAAENKALSSASTNMKKAESTLKEIDDVTRPERERLKGDLAAEEEKVADLKAAVQEDAAAEDQDQTSTANRVSAARDAADASEQEANKVATENTIKLREEEVEIGRDQSSLTSAKITLSRSEADLKTAKVKATEAKKAAIKASVKAKQDELKVAAAKQKVEETEAYINKLVAKRVKIREEADAEIAKMREEQAAAAGHDSTIEERIRMRKDRAKREITETEDELERVRGQKAQLETFYKQINSKDEQMTREAAEMDRREQRAAQVARKEANEARKAVDQAADLVRSNKAVVKTLQDTVRLHVQKIQEEAHKKEQERLEFRTKAEVVTEDELHSQAEIEREETLSSLEELQHMQESRFRAAQAALVQHQIKRQKKIMHGSSKHPEKADTATKTAKPYSGWKRWTCPKDPEQRARIRVQKPSVCNGGITMSTEDVNSLSQECGNAFSQYAMEIYGNAILDFATDMYGHGGCKSISSVPSDLNIAAVKLLTAMQGEYTTAAPVANNTISAHHEAERLLKHADAVEASVKDRFSLKGSSVGSHLTDAISKAKEAVKKVIEAHNEIHSSTSTVQAGPTLTEKKPWVCESDMSVKEPTVHFDKPCDSFASIASSVGSGVANRFAGVFILGGSTSPLHGACKTELMSEAALRFGNALLDLKRHIAKCTTLRELSKSVVSASMELRGVAAYQLPDTSHAQKLGDTSSTADSLPSDGKDLNQVLDSHISAARKQVDDIVRKAQATAEDMRLQLKTAKKDGNMQNPKIT